MVPFCLGAAEGERGRKEGLCVLMRTWFEESAAVGVVLWCRGAWAFVDVAVTWKRAPRRRRAIRKRARGGVARRSARREERKTGSLSIIDG